MTFPTKINWGDIAVDLGIALDICAVIGYAFHGDFKKSLYWGFCAGAMLVMRLM